MSTPPDTQPDKPTDEKPTVASRVQKIRAAHPWLDHLFVAGTRYVDRQGDYYAAGVTYFSVLAIFPLLLVATAVLGLFVRYDPDIIDQVSDALEGSVPAGIADLLVQALSTAQNSAAGIGIVSLLFFGYSALGWISNLRVGVQKIWGEPAEEPPFVKAKLRDLGTLVGLGIALLVTIALSSVTGALTGFVVDLLGLQNIPGAKLITGAATLAAALLTDFVIFVFVMTTLPGQKVAVRSVLRGALLGAVGFEAIKIVATVYLDRLTSSPAYAVFGAILGLLFFVNLISRLLLFVVAWTATSRAQQLVAVEGTPDAVSPVPGYVLATDAAATGPTVRVAPTAILAVLLAIGATIGAILPAFVRRWWNGAGRDKG